MAFSIDDIIRYFSQAADGQRMTNDPVPSGKGILNQPTQAVAAPSQGPAQRPQQFTPVGAANPTDQRLAAGTQQPPMEAAMRPERDEAGSEAMIARASASPPIVSAMEQNPTDQRLANGTQMSPQPPQAEPGILSGIGSYLNKSLGLDRPDLLSRIGQSLAVAGSQDPFKALMMLREQQGNEEKVRAEQSQKNKPKFTPLGPGTVMVEYQGKVDFMPVEQARSFALQMEGVKATNSQDRALAVAAETERLKAKAAADKSALDAVPELAANRTNLVELRSIAGELGSLGADKKFVPSKKADSLTGFVAGNVAALPLGAGEALNGEAVDLRQRAQKVVQGGLRAVLGGQYTQNEGEAFLARAYNPRLNPEANFRSLQRAADELETLLGDKVGAQAYYQKNRTLAGFVPGSVTKSDEATTPAGVSSPTSKAAYDALPAGTQYVAPDGKTYTKR